MLQCTSPSLPTEHTGTHSIIASTCFSHLLLIISTPHWWSPIRVKQLSVALASFVGWLGRRIWSLVPTNRKLVPWPSISAMYTWPVDAISNDHTLPSALHFFFDAVEAHCCVNIWTEVNYINKIRNRKSKYPGRFDHEGLRLPRRLSSADEDLWGQNVPGFYSSCCVFCSYTWLPFTFPPCCTNG